MPAPDLRLNGEHLKTLDINDACRYLGYWGAGNGDMSATRLLVTIGKVVAQSKRVSHMGRKNGPKTRFSARP